MTIEVKAEQLQKADVWLANVKDGVSKALASALNRTAQNVAAEATRKTRETYDIKAGDVRRTVRISRATKNNLTAYVKSLGSPIPLIQFKVRPSRPPKRPPAVLTASVKRSGGKPIPGAFVSTMNSGHMGVFERVGKKRLPVRELHGPPAPTMLNEPGVRQHIEEQAVIRLEKRLDHEILRLLGGD